MLTNRNVIVGKIETTPGVDSTPTAANAIAVRSLNVTPVEVEVVENKIQRPTMGASKSLHAGKHAVLDFEIAMSGGGAAGVEPQYDEILRSCGRAKTIVADTSVTYAPIDSDLETMTFFWYMDGCVHKITGALGQCEISINKSDVIILKASYVGLYSPVSTADLPTVDFSAYINPVPVGALTTPEFKLYGIDTKLEKLDIKDGADIKYRNVVGGQSIIQTNREMSGSMVIESPAIATTNWWDKIVENNESGTLLLKHGTVAGHIIEFGAPDMQLKIPKYGDSDGVVTLEMDFVLAPVTGNDEFSITFK